ncbi:MAG: glycosyltransferase, partial [Mycoplasma sp.]
MKNSQLTILIPSYNRPESIDSLLKDIYESNFDWVMSIRICIIDDCSKKDYSNVIAKYSKVMNLDYHKVQRNGGKNKAIFTAIKNFKIKGKIAIIDDDMNLNFSWKDYINIELTNNECICINIYDTNSKKIIGDCPKLNMKFNDFYHKKLKHGDKIWIHNSEVLDLDEMKTFYIQNEN